MGPGSSLVKAAGGYGGDSGSDAAAYAGWNSVAVNRRRRARVRREDLWGDIHHRILGWESTEKAVDPGELRGIVKASVYALGSDSGSSVAAGRT